MNNQEFEKKYPSYFKSIFSDFKPDDSEVLGWKENVLKKVRGNNILPHYIKKDKDFDIFWGWIIHFFAIIVYFVRNFQRLFIIGSKGYRRLKDKYGVYLNDKDNNQLVVFLNENIDADYNSYLDEIGEYMREKDYIQDSRVKINKDLIIPSAGQIYHKIFCDCSVNRDGSIMTNFGYDTTDFLPVNNGSRIVLKILGYNKSLLSENNVGNNIYNVFIACYDSEKNVEGFVNPFNITAYQAKLGYKLDLPVGYNNPICYIRVSYPHLGNASLPIYLGVFLEGEDTSFSIKKTENDIFDIYPIFRKRGTFKGVSLIKKVLESKKEDNFYADYLSQRNTGWFLNRNSPIFERLFEGIKIDYFLVEGISRTTGYLTTISLKEQYFILNQNTSLIIKWRGKKVDSVGFKLSIYDKNKRLLNDVPILGEWEYDSINHVLNPSIVDSVLVYPKYDSDKELNIAELAIEIIDNPKSAVFSTDTFDKYRFTDDLNKIYLFSKFNNDKSNEAYYLKLTYIELHGEDAPHILNNDYKNVDVGLFLRKLPITLGFLNNKQYYLCCFQNNGSFSNDKAIELISQKIIPYNGYRIFIDNSYYKNKVNVPLDLLNVFFNKQNKKIYLEVIGGVPPYEYWYDNDLVPLISFLQNYEKEVENYGLHTVRVVDSLGESVLAKISCQPYNVIDYKFKLYVGRDNSIQILISLFGGSETSYTISVRLYFDAFLYDNESNQLLDNGGNELLSREFTETTDDNKKIGPPNVWMDITNIVGNNFSYITPNTFLYIRDNGVPVQHQSWLIDVYNDLELQLQDLFKDFGVDFYDNGKGELKN